MSTKAVIIWLALAVLLGVIAIVLLLSPNLTGSGTSALPIGSKLLNFSASEVLRVTVLRADGTQEIIEKAPNATSTLGVDTEWQLRIKGAKPEDYTPPPWPVTGPAMQSLLRILSDLATIGEPAKDATLGERPVSVIIAFNDGAERTLRLADRTLAGTCLAEVLAAPAGTGANPRPAQPHVRALIDGKVQDLFTNPGPRAWRETSLLAALAPEASRIRLENPRQKLALGKTDGRWSLREPVAAPADPSAVQALVAELSRVHVADFLDAGAGTTPTGLEKPEARLAVEIDRRTMEPGKNEPTIKTGGVEIAIGLPAESSRGRVFASINGERVVLVDANALARISMDATAYIWPHPTRLAGADIGTVVLDRTDTPNGAGSKAFNRSLARWTQLRPDGSEVTLADKELRDADALVAFLTGGDRSAFAGNTAAPQSREDRPVITTSAPSDLRIVGRIAILSIVGDPMDTLEIGVARPGSAVIRTGPVYREYLVGKLPTLLNDLINAAPPSAPSEAEKKPEMNK